MKKITTAAAGLVLGLSMASASAVTVDVDLSGAYSCDLPGAPCNLTTTIDLTAFAAAPIALTGVGWDVTIETVGASWLSEAVISLQNPVGSELFTLTAGAGDNAPGLASYSSGGIIDLNAALGFQPLISDGMLTLEFYESFDDVSGAIDAFYLDGSKLTLEFETFVAASEPTVLALLGLGLVGIAFARRRRS